jgi:hypothetical protein
MSPRAAAAHVALAVFAVRVSICNFAASPRVKLSIKSSTLHCNHRIYGSL